MQKYPRRTVGAPLTYPRKWKWTQRGAFIADVQTPHGWVRVTDAEKGLSCLEPDPSRLPTRLIRLKGKHRPC